MTTLRICHSNPSRTRPWVAAAMVAGVAAVAGCAGTSQSSAGPLYRCEHGIEFTARFIDDSAVLEGTRGYDVLYRDAGGQGPQQSVYSNPRMRAEFGLGASGREAVLRYPSLPLVARCVRE
ncbi:hypothetical protein [Polaromonas sp. YR568]|uniref:hypothetical protein n=1 Tax=Polaromonas sp. YR568 TaxID=1855301 RepID=UPI003137B5B2